MLTYSQEKRQETQPLNDPGFGVSEQDSLNSHSNYTQWHKEVILTVIERKEISAEK